MAARRARTRPTGVFISYRREDASGFAGRLHESLSRHFGPGRVFRDVDTIEPGANFPELITTSLRSCGAFVVVIGREWLVDLRGRRRLDDPTDWVRIELEAALGRDGVLVIPVLVEGAAMPSRADLPDSLVALGSRHALEVSDSRWSFDVLRLVESLEAVVGPPPNTWPARLRRWLIPTRPIGAIGRVTAAAAVVLVLARAVAPLVQTSSRSAPMNVGTYNVAVAEFEGVDADGRQVDSPEAQALAQSVSDLLADGLTAIDPKGFELRAPREMGRIRGSPEQQANAAAAEAQRIRADVVVYGTLSTEVPNDFAAHFFVNDRKLRDAEELFGQHDLGASIATPGDIGGNPEIYRDLLDEIHGRARALVEFIVGLSFFGANKPQPALEHLEAARDTGGWDDGDGKEVLYFFLGNVAGTLGNLDQARSYYDQALTLDPEYARARLGRAEVLLHASKGGCETGDVDTNGLRDALDAYRSALTARAQPALANIPTKVAFGEGRVHLCLSQALVGDYWSEAEQKFRQVIDEFLGGNDRVRALAGESYAHLGVVHLPASGDPDAPKHYRQAADDYQRAIDIVRDDERKAGYAGMRGFIFARLGDVAQAEEAYMLAIQLSEDPDAQAEYERARRALTVNP